MNKLSILIRCTLFYIIGHIETVFNYDGKYLQGKWFKGKYGSFGSVGWQWVVCSARARRRYKINTSAKFPVSIGCRVVHPENIFFHPDDLNNFQSFGIYYQAIEKITIGKGSFIGPNVGLITANHDTSDLNSHQEAKPITLGENCWIGMNSIILPGVTLGPNTTVGAGSVVTKSFPEGHCIIAGNPARLLRQLDLGEEK